VRRGDKKNKGEEKCIEKKRKTMRDRSEKGFSLVLDIIIRVNI